MSSFFHVGRWGHEAAAPPGRVRRVSREWSVSFVSHGLIWGYEGDEVGVWAFLDIGSQGCGGFLLPLSHIRRCFVCVMVNRHE